MVWQFKLVSKKNLCLPQPWLAGRWENLENYYQQNRHTWWSWCWSVSPDLVERHKHVCLCFWHSVLPTLFLLALDERGTSVEVTLSVPGHGVWVRVLRALFRHLCSSEVWILPLLHPQENRYQIFIGKPSCSLPTLPFPLSADGRDSLYQGPMAGSAGIPFLDPLPQVMIVACKLSYILFGSHQ